MSEKLSLLRDKILLSFEKENRLKEFVTVNYKDLDDFESLRYLADTEFMKLPEGYLFDDFARGISNDLSNIELQYFFVALTKEECETIEITLDGLVNSLQKTYDEIFDIGSTPNQLFVSPELNNLIRVKRQTPPFVRDFSSWTNVMTWYDLLERN